ncbi:MAG: magnesium transporter CorA family protein [Bacteroidales bacterium]|nr:magnesium transporter CorA family protein [Bacteroidales bacterium]
MKTYLINGKGLEYSDKWQKDAWINIEEPTSSDKDYLLNEIKIPEAFYNDIEDIDERPRIEYEDGWFLIILRVPVKTNDPKLPFSTVPMGIIFNDVYFTTICFYKTEMVSDFIQYAKRKNILKTDNFDLVFRLHLSSSVWFMKYLKQINQNIKLAEQELEESIKNEDLQTLFQIEKCLVYFATSLRANDILAHRLKNLKDFKHTFDDELIEDVDIELRQALEMTNIYSNILTGMMDAYASVISNNLNVIMKRLTSISIILMIPTLIASLYGMNVPNFLERNNYAFVGIIVVTCLISIFAIISFRKYKWF